MSELDARVISLEKKNEELNKLVTSLVEEITTMEKRIGEMEAAKKQGGGGGGDGKSKKQAKKEKKKGGGGGGDKKEEKKPDGEADAKARAKAIAASFKEGGKKGQDLCGMSDLGGMAYFTVAMEKCGDDWELLNKTMDGANAEIDPNGDDRKGGAGGLGKCFMGTTGNGVVNFLYHVPAEVQKEKGLSLKEWVDCMLNDTRVVGEILEITETTCKAICKANPDANLFPLKQRDAAISASFELLRSKDLIPVEEDSDEDMGAMYEDAGIEW